MADFDKLETLLTMGARAFSKTDFGPLNDSSRIQTQDQPASDIQFQEKVEVNFIWGVHRFGTHQVKIGR